MHTGLPQRHGTPVPEKILRHGSNSPGSRCTAHNVIPSCAPRDSLTDGGHTCSDGQVTHAVRRYAVDDERTGGCPNLSIALRAEEKGVGWIEDGSRLLRHIASLDASVKQNIRMT